MIVRIKSRVVDSNGFFMKIMFVILRITFNDMPVKPAGCEAVSFSNIAIYCFYHIHIKMDKMEIKILGTGCASCKALYATVERAVAELGLDAKVVKEENLPEIMRFNVLSMPALAVDGIVVSSGRKLTVGEVKKLLTQ